MPCGFGRNPKDVKGIVETLFIAKDIKVPFQQNDHVVCPECGWRIYDDFRWCPNCSTRLKPVQCEYCGGIIPRDLQDCQRCGAPVA